MILTYEQFLHRLNVPDTSLIKLAYSLYLEICEEQRKGETDHGDNR